MTTHPHSPWDKETTAALELLWAEGVGCTGIAAALGHGITRNAVIGKVSRLGLTPRSKRAYGRIDPPRAPRKPKGST